ncbi:MAG: hypothetical protein ACKVX7_00660 [Planctomycetota bacterium]
MRDAAGGFEFASRHALAFLEEELGFHVYEMIAPREASDSLTAYRVTYHRQPPGRRLQFVTLSTAPLRAELDLVVGCGWPPRHEDTINVLELLAVESPEAVIEYSAGIYEAFGDRVKLSAQYTVLARLLREHGLRFFEDSRALWEAVSRRREQQTISAELKKTSQSADAAFTSGKWQRAIELFEQLGAARTKLQSARLAFARKRIVE